ncbi:MAG: HAD-IIIA family hydrolase, partial [Ignavibacteria bacterium]|nr:HAD-IIIA family hydrolase [Ignavibacteria bacterium]
MDKAIFLDRDGVINELIYSGERKEFEPPFFENDIKIISGVIESLKLLQQFNFRLILVSNQPDYAKGKTSLKNLIKVHDEIHKIFLENKIKFSKYNYCYHHPDGVVKEFAKECECRKPKPYFVLHAIKEFDIDMKKSWFIGDRDTDIE